MNIKNLVLDYIGYKQLSWYSHIRRINKKSLPQTNLEWFPPGKEEEEDLEIRGCKKLQLE